MGVVSHSISGSEKAVRYLFPKTPSTNSLAPALVISPQQFYQRSGK